MNSDLRRGVVLAGGKGTRLGELTKVTNKHLLPVGEYPMIYHPIKKLVAAGITEILLVSGTEHMGDFIELLGSGKALGCRLTYRVQDEAGGIAQALALAQQFCFGARSMVLLGDNIFGEELADVMPQLPYDFAWVFLKEVEDPSRYGVATVRNGEVVEIEEKPKSPKSRYAVTGIYMYPPDVFDVVKTLKPSNRGELEITDVNNWYLRQGRLRHRTLNSFWTDAGTLQSLRTANELTWRTTVSRIVDSDAS